MNARETERGKRPGLCISLDSLSFSPSWEQSAGLRDHCSKTKGLFLCFTSRCFLGIKVQLPTCLSSNCEILFTYFTLLISFCLGSNAQHIKNNPYYINGYIGAAFYSCVFCCSFFLCFFLYFSRKIKLCL